jgi:SAM-dependent methyltransferase
VNSILDHYENHLAPIYVWMAGGVEHALSLGGHDVAPFLDPPGLAVDLGAGFGMHSIPLARAGHQVLAVDTSRLLLAELRRHGEGLDVTAIEADLLDFAAHLPRPADLILCMGDTLTHLKSMRDVERLLRSVADALRPEGRFVATFRDYRDLPMDDRRFISVRSDSERIQTCFLEAVEERVRVHDIIHERVHEAWAMKVSSYEKLRLAPEAVLRAARRVGMRCRIEPGPRGMVMIVADAPSGVSDQRCR